MKGCKYLQGGIRRMITQRTNIQEILFYFTISLPIFLLFRTIGNKKIKSLQQKTTVFHETGILILIVYIIMLFSKNIGPALRSSGKLEGTINLIPVNETVEWVLKAYERNYIIVALKDIFSRMVLFVPVGLFITLLWNMKNSLWSVFYGGILSLLLQACRFFLIRDVNVDTVILNVLGAFIGYLGYVLIRMVFPNFVENCRVIKNEEKEEEFIRLESIVLRK